MSVIVTLKMTGDPNGLQQFASANADKMQEVVQAAQQHGVIAHRFYGSAEGDKIMVIDEWPDRESFESFFQEQQPQIQPMMEAAGVSSQPEVTFWQKLETHDDFGWGA